MASCNLMTTARILHCPTDQDLETFLENLVQNGNCPECLTLTQNGNVITVSNGTLSADICAECHTLTDNGNGTYTLTNGTDTVVIGGDSVTIADNGDGTYTISDGTNNPTVPDITDNGDGTFTVTDGTNTFITCAECHVLTDNGDGTYTLTDGTDTAIIPDIVDNGDGTYTITDGANNPIVPDIIDNGNGTYTVTDGTNTFTTCAECLTLADNGNGSHTITGPNDTATLWEFEEEPTDCAAITDTTTVVPIPGNGWKKVAVREVLQSAGGTIAPAALDGSTYLTTGDLTIDLPDPATLDNCDANFINVKATDPAHVVTLNAPGGAAIENDPSISFSGTGVWSPNAGGAAKIVTDGTNYWITA